MNICMVMPKATFLIDPMVYPPLGLWYLAAQLEAQGHVTHFRDLSVHDFPYDGEYDQVWISATSAQMTEVRKLSDTTKHWHHTATVVGGPAAWVHPEVFDDLGFDVVAIGECDYPEAIEKIVGLAAEARVYGVVTYFAAKQPANLDHVLPPIRRWSHLYKAQLEGQPTTTMFTSRGCPMACAFCESGRNGVIWDKVVRYESMGLVTKQLDDIQRLGFTAIQFYDDILPLNKPRMIAIIEALKERGFIWRCFLRTDVIEKQGGYEYLKAMRDAGLVEVLAGVESADNRIKANIHKGTTIEQDTKALAWCKDLGIKFKASLILGLPGETRESMEATRNWILTQRPDRVDVNILIPFPGTPIMRNPADYDVYWTEKLPEEFWYKGPRQGMGAIVGTSQLPPQEIEAFRDGLMKEVEAAGIPY